MNGIAMKRDKDFKKNGNVKAIAKLIGVWTVEKTKKCCWAIPVADANPPAPTNW